ncbi:hypothetical protein CBF23_013530 [Marinomonas agarivorans]|nr:hypothetical protein CBF23_013530 [Marinomonas agarivorans]
MFSCTSHIDIHAELEEVWEKVANLDRYPNWSPCFTFVQNLSPKALGFVDSQFSFNMVRFKDRVKYTAIIKEFTVPYRLRLSFACPYRFWLEEQWCFSLTVEADNLITVRMELSLSGWQKVKIYQQQMPMLQAFCEAHLEALKTSLETLGKDDTDDFLVSD